MGFPFDTPTWDGVEGAIFMGLNGAVPGILSVIAIVICVAALLLGNAGEAKKYKPHK